MTEGAHWSARLQAGRAGDLRYAGLNLHWNPARPTEDPDWIWVWFWGQRHRMPRADFEIRQP